jgi:microsomal dipeptidase-like Zn-dependent dipeptidase
VEENDDLELITSVADIRRVKQAGHVGALLSFEGLSHLTKVPTLFASRPFGPGARARS